MTKKLTNNKSIEAILKEIKHGLDDEGTPEERLVLMEAFFKLYFTSKRHGPTLNKNFEIVPGEDQFTNILDWRLRDKQKTVTVALVLCLNIGVDPPDIVKPEPCAKVECWLDPTSLTAPKALEAIGKNLQQQYEVWQPRARYKLSLDPSVEETRKLCCTLRRSSKDERILFHYNGHGVPKPTASGEIWVFNKNYTQYIPINIRELQSWLGAPCMYVYDCSAAGNIIKAFNLFAKHYDSEASRLQGSNSVGSRMSLQESIQFAACDSDEILPVNPELPADVFTSCMTTPIEMAMRWYVMRNPLLTKIDPEMILKLPGRLNDRRTPLGDLSWIFTSITDTIAWNLLPSHTFKRLFRQDLMVAALFRNFLLADRVMRSLKCHPISVPQLPSTHHHPLWKSWDLAVDLCLSQLPALVAAEEGGPPVEYQNSPFFTEQLTAFEVWLSHGSVKKTVPEQLPIVLQVLLSQVHRARALRLLSQFLDLGLWAVNAALLVGIFPYVLKLLQSPSVELKPVLTFIWARLLPADTSCQEDLLKDNGYMYFLDLLKADSGHNFVNLSEHRGMCAFIIANFCKNFNSGKVSLLKHNVIGISIPHLSDPDPFLRQWCCLMLGQLWLNFNDAKKAAYNLSVHESILPLLNDSIPEVRSSAIFALSTLIEGDLSATPQIDNVKHNLSLSLEICSSDGSPLVRKEWIVFASYFVNSYSDQFVQIATELIVEELNLKNKALKHIDDSKLSLGKASKLLASTANANKPTINRSPIQLSPIMDSGSGAIDEPFKLIYLLVWKTLLIVTKDPFPSVSQGACKIVDHIHSQLLTTNAKVIQQFISGSSPPHSPVFNSSKNHVANNYNTVQPSQLGFNRKSILPDTIKRSASFTMKNIYKFGQGDTEVNSNGEKVNQAFTAGEDLTSHKVKNSSVDNCINPPNGTSSTLDELVVPSYYFDWCCKKFQDPQMRPSEDEEPGSIVYHQRLWRRLRNDRVIAETDVYSTSSNHGKWNYQYAALPNEFQPCNLTFHRYESHLIAADNKNCISVWDWENKVRVQRLQLPDPRAVAITNLQLINEEDEAILVCGLDDGNVRLYSKYWSNPTLASAFLALGELPVGRKPFRNRNAYPSLALSWQQGRGALIAGGESSSIKVWDVSVERNIGDFPTRSTTGITSLTSDTLGGNFLVAGFQDGSLRAYDRRLAPRDSMVKCWREHQGSIIGCHLQEGSTRELVSASLGGEVKIWDIRHSTSLHGFATPVGINAFAVHDLAPIVAIGTTNSGASVYNLSGKYLGTTYHYHSSAGILLSQKVSPIHNIKFHPRRMLLAMGTGGGIFGPTGPPHPNENTPTVTLASWDAPIIKEDLSSFTVSFNPTHPLGEAPF